MSRGVVIHHLLRVEMKQRESSRPLAHFLFRGSFFHPFGYLSSKNRRRKRNKHTSNLELFRGWLESS